MNADKNPEIQFLKGVGPKRAQLLESELGVKTVSDLVHIFPFRHIDKSTFQNISEISGASANIQIKARVISVALIDKQGKKVAEAGNQINYNTLGRLVGIISDGTAQMEVVFFKAIRYIHNRLVPGKEFIFFGKPTVFNGKINMVHPEIDDITSPSAGTGKMTGVYPSTEKLKNAGITGKVMNKIIDSALNVYLPGCTETLPDYIIREKGLVTRCTALKNIHFPEDLTALSKAEYRLKFEELFLLQLSLLKQKYIRSRNEKGIIMNNVGQVFHKCYQSLPYDLTGAQKRVIREIREDMRSGKQMNRLLQGDVGSGKTMVAVLSALIAVGNGYQACLMAPTEVLARQHFANIGKYLSGTGAQISILTGTTRAAERRTILEDLQSGKTNIIVGTHALIEDNVIFHKLGLAIIDEQHRFGVEQRARLWNKTGAIAPHILVMTATPIPRTLAMTLYGDLDVSVIDEMPPGRKPVRTIQITESQRLSLYKFIREQIASGRQAFIVYPMIFENDKLDCKNIEQGYEEIMNAFPIPKYKTALVHGQQSEQDKKFNMDAFVAGRANILVSTTVIEVGVDVPNATVMVIESPDRFGLSQLHQLRGRVGRGGGDSFCILVKGKKLSNDSKKRIDLLCSTEDGFVLAEEDMKLRGPGDLEGTQQSGLPVELNIASLAKDGAILSDARAYAMKILERDPELSLPENQKLLAEMRKSKYNKTDYSKIS